MAFDCFVLLWKMGHFHFSTIGKEKQNLKAIKNGRGLKLALTS